MILCIGLTGFSVGCKSVHTIGQDVREITSALAPPMPVEPITEPVRFLDREGGLWLSYADYRALERNMIALREYTHMLKIVIQFYTREE